MFPRRIEAVTEPGAKPAPLPSNEIERLLELQAFRILDTLPEQPYDDITALAAEICGTPIALVSLVDEKRQWFKSRVGLDVPELSRDVAFCAYAILDASEPLVVPDATADERFRTNPLVTGEPGIRFYAGAPLVTRTGNAVGTLCVIDREHRDLTAAQLRALTVLARRVVAELEINGLRNENEELRQQVAAARMALATLANVESGHQTIAFQFLDQWPDLPIRQADH